MKKLHFDFIQAIASLLGAIFGTVAGVLIGIMSSANIGITVGYVSGYEVGGAVGGVIGAWLGSVLGIMLVAKLSHTDKEGSLILSLLFSLLGAGLLFAGMTLVVPVLNSPLMIGVIAALAYLGWNISDVLRRKKASG